MPAEARDQVLALAGVVQASWLVTNAAHTGMITQDSFEGCVGSLFVFDPGTTLDVYGGLESIRPGLKMTAELLAAFNLREHGDQIRYVLAMMAVERQLARQPNMLQYLGEQLREIQRDVIDNDSDTPLGDNVVAAIAALYQETISTVEPRIRIVGNRHHLQNEHNVNRIRALLLAGIRSAVLWRQVGGRRWHLLLGRSRLRQSLADLARG